jgi:hypothetical protein
MLCTSSVQANVQRGMIVIITCIFTSSRCVQVECVMYMTTSYVRRQTGLIRGQLLVHPCRVMRQSRANVRRLFLITVACCRAGRFPGNLERAVIGSRASGAVAAGTKGLKVSFLKCVREGESRNRNLGR